jgi:GMP synthase-like glutamine amidotransferase
MNMRTLLVLQHTESEFLGLMEDHLEGRGIAFRYVRPFAGSDMPGTAALADGLVLLGGGGWGTVGGLAGEHRLPDLDHEVRLTRDFLNRNKPVIGIGLGAQILCLAAGGDTEAAPLRFSAGQCRRVDDGAMNGHMPEHMPHAVFMRDRPILPADAAVLAVDDAGDPAIFQVGARSLGFTGHPGFKAAMFEDLILECEEGPDDPLPVLEQIRALQQDGAEALSRLMVGIIQVTGLMRPYDEKERKRRTVIPIQRT